MAQTTNVMNSSLFKLYADGTAVGYSTNVSVNLVHNPRDTTTKDNSGGFHSFLEGSLSGTANVAILYAEDAAHGLDEVWTAYVGRATMALLIGYNQSGDTTIGADAYVTSIDMESPEHNQNVTASVGFQLTGTIARTVVV